MNTDLNRLWVFPMHGELKLRGEGFRTRDGHLCQWFARLGVDDLHISSRPEPWPRLRLSRMRHPIRPELPQARWHSPEIVRLPSLTARREWWHTTSRHTALWESEPPQAAVVWNPFAFERIPDNHAVPVVFDLLDDWTIHHQFAPIRGAVQAAYRRAFSTADLVFANAEGTIRLAQRYGRDDATLLPNGVDPEGFSTTSTATGPTTIGYAGKISERLDVELIRAAVAALPDCRFVIAGPSYSKSVSLELASIPALITIGDVPYADYPALLSGWDIGWVPHRTGDGEIGGDVIKTYEYRAAGLPTFVTPIEGAGRGLAGVRVAVGQALIDELVELVATAQRSRIPRELTEIPDAMTWRSKARTILSAIDSLGIR